MKKIPMRMCVACKSMKPKNEMLRVVCTADTNTYVLDPTGKLNGRGAYICNNETCINKCVKSKLLNRSFKTNVGEQIYDDVKENSIGANSNQT